MKVKTSSISIFIFVFFCSNLTLAQNWQTLNGGTDWNVADLFADTVSGQLFISGAFQHTGNIEANGVAVWDGSEFETFGTGVDNCITTCPVVVSVAMWQGDLFCSPTSYSMGGVLDPKGLMRWNGEMWNKVGGGLSFLSGNNGLVYDFLPQDSSLILLGGFQLAGTDTVYNVARWNGEQLTSLGFPYANPELGIIGKVQSGLIKDGTLYVGGNFQKELGIENTIDFAWFFNGNWHQSDQNIKGGNDDIGKMITYKGEIYVGGNFRVSSGNAGNAIMRFQDGIFVDVGGSFDSELANIRDMVVFDGKLFVFGLFNSVGGGIPAQNIASWDGEKWCGYGFDFDHLIRTAEVLGDRLYIGGPFDSINYQPYNHLAFWEGELEPTVCGNLVNTAPIEKRTKIRLNLFPNPTSSALHIQLQHAQSTQGKLQIENLSGQTLHTETLNLSPTLQSWQVDVADWPSGVYVVRLQAGSEQVVRKFVVE
ncbi:T9SS type A sorting domain-containing protein [Phaeodactylibacter xiamenensis]|uniref:T9SS type A sorting domain-containing protein n=1 Tax=Phaeodactylibacter xiamenensis TaxID=1524460 RepID=UPI003CCC3AC5